jgi:hypothetical protein
MTPGRPWWGTQALSSASGQSAADTPHDSPSRQKVRPSSSLVSSSTDASPASGARHDRKEWQAHWAAFGEVELQASADSRGSVRVVCKIQHGVLTMSIPPPTSDRLQVLPPPPPGTASTASAASGPYSSHLSE